MEEEYEKHEPDRGEEALWKAMQKSTFSRWCNMQLRMRRVGSSSIGASSTAVLGGSPTQGTTAAVSQPPPYQIMDLYVDFSDGLMLIALVEALTSHLFRKTNKRPAFRTQKLENVTQALNYLETEEGIRLVNIDSSDIVDSNSKLILGLIWTLILHYSVASGVWEDDEQPAGRTSTLGHSFGRGRSGASQGAQQADAGAGQLRMRLLGWINSKMPDRPVANLTTDWNDGKAIGALVDAIAPGLCPDWLDWDAKQPLRNAKEAMEAAETWMNVQQLIKPEEMVDPRVDEKAMITYLAQYPSAKLRPDAPLRPRANAARVRAYGPGLEASGNTVGTLARFTVETYSAGRGQLEVAVMNARNVREPAEVTFNEDREQSYTCVYTPASEGEYHVSIRFAGREIPRSPFRVKVQDQPGDASKVTAAGPGLQSREVFVGRRTHFEVNTKGAGKGILDVTIVSPQALAQPGAEMGSNQLNVIPIKAHLTKRSDDVTVVEYTPRVEGPHQIQVLFAGQNIPKSPFDVLVASPFDPHKVTVTGRGVQANGVRVKDAAEFVVHTEGAGSADLSVKVTGPNNSEETCKVRRVDSKYVCSYTPLQAGAYSVRVDYGGKAVRRSPFAVSVRPELLPGGSAAWEKIRAFGPGLHGGYVNYPATFTLDTGAQKVQIGFRIEGPSEAKINVEDKLDGSANITYFPTAAGEYAVHILVNEEDIPSSPFLANIITPPNGYKLDFDPSKVLISGPGIENAVLNTPTQFTVDARPAFPEGTPGVRPAGSSRPSSMVGNTPPSSPPGGSPMHRPQSFPTNAPFSFTPNLQVQVLDTSTGLLGDVHAAPTHEGPTTYTYTPRTTAKHLVYVVLGGLNAGKSPFRVKVAEPARAEKIRVSGPGITMAKRNQQTEFTVDLRDAGVAELSVGVLDERGHLVKVETTQEQTRASLGAAGAGPVVKVTYTPTSAGRYTAEVLFGGKPVTGSPFPITVQPDIDISRITVEGLETKYFVQSLAEFLVDARSVDDKGKREAKIVFNAPNGKQYLANVVNRKDGTYLCTIPITEKGSYKAEAYYDELELKPAGSPFEFEGQTGSDSSRVLVTGEPLRGGFTDERQLLLIDTKRAGDGAVGLTMEGPVEAKLEFHDLHNGMCECSFVPPKAGDYLLRVLFDRKEVPGSPFTIAIKDRVNPARVKVSGPGIDPKEGPLRAAKPAKFSVDARGAGEAPLEVKYAPLSGASGSRRSAMEQQADVRTHGDGLFDVVYYPQTEGNYSIAVNYGGQPITGSPFARAVGPAFDEKAVLVSGDVLKLGSPSAAGVPAGAPQTLTVDARNAGDAELEVAVTDRLGNPLHVVTTTNMDGTYSCSFLPEEPGLHQVNVSYGKKPVPDSPFLVKVVPFGDASKCRILSGKVKVVPIDRESRILVHQPAIAATGGEPHLTARVTRPDGIALQPLFGPVIVPGAEGVLVQELDADEADAAALELAARLDVTGDDSNEDFSLSAVSYIPRVLGEHQVVLNYGGVQVPEGKFVQKVVPLEEYSKLSAAEIEDEALAAKFTRASLVGGARRGPLDIFSLPPTAFMPVDFKLPPELIGDDISSLQAYAIAPSGKRLSVNILDNKDGTASLYFQPAEKGMHELHVSQAGVPITGSPFKVYSDLVGSGTVTAFGPGLSNAQVGQPATFTLVTRNAAPGGLSIGVEGPSKAEIQIEESKVMRGTCNCHYVPMAPGDYTIAIKHAEQHIPGSPFTARVVGASRIRGPELQLSRGGGGPASTTSTGTAEFRVMPVPRDLYGELDISQLVATIRLPSGKEEPCGLAKVPGGYLGVTFTPKEVGEHLVQVLYQGKHIPGSPAKLIITENEIANPKKVKCYGEGLKAGFTNQANKFTIDATNAGYGALTLSIEGPSKAELDCADNPDGTNDVSYVPFEPGTYHVNVKYADGHVTGSPFTVEVLEGFAADAVDTERGDSVVRRRERLLQLVTRERQAASVAQVGTLCEMNIALPASQKEPFDLSAWVRAPSGHYEKCDVLSPDCRNFVIRFTPHEVGVHQVEIRLNNLGIPGSPFLFTVGSPASGGAAQVRASGEGLSRAVVSQSAEFMINTHEAGAGSLAIAVEGPSKAEINFEDKRDGSSLVSYKVASPGDYSIAIRFNEVHIPGSPFAMVATTSSGEVIDRATLRSSRVTFDPSVGVLGRPLSTYVEQSTAAARSSLQMGVATRPNAAFTVNYTEAGRESPAQLRAIVENPLNREEEAEVTELEPGQYAVRFEPRMAGKHMVSVLSGTRHVPGSPFAINVAPNLTTAADPTCVHATGPGLAHGLVGQKCRFVVNTLGAGVGPLAVTVTGPSRAPITCAEVDEGYEFSYVPSAPGEYAIAIRYGNFHIVGSPFTAFISGPPVTTSLASVVGESTCVVETREKRVTEAAYSHAEQVNESLAHARADRVQCHGIGLKRAVACRPTQFQVDVRDAVSTTEATGDVAPCRSALMVGMMGVGQTSRPVDELIVKHQSRDQFAIEYTVRETGRYALLVMWGNQHVPGSPFFVDVV